MGNLRESKRRAQKNKSGKRRGGPVADAMTWKQLPGYHWVRRIGSGGSGAVFEVTAPGGYPKAAKIVSLDRDNVLSCREREGLALIRDIRHPYLLSVDRVDVDADHLTVIMELADCSLRDEFRRRTVKGHQGIGRELLLSLLEEAAEVLDLLNQTYKLQHMDIKPDNLFMVSGHIKVGDFGLLRQAESGRIDQATNAISPHYAAPELFGGVVSRSCDQYSLAVVYMEMLTGRRPHTATEVRQAAMQHLVRPRDLYSLPESDRPIVGRALSTNPSDRYESCRAFVRALVTASDNAIDLPAPITRHEREKSAIFGLVLAKTVRNGELEPEFVPLGNPTASTFETCLAEATPSALLPKIRAFTEDWGAELLDIGPDRATIRFAARSTLLRRILGRTDWLTVELNMFQREGLTTKTLVNMCIRYYGRKLRDTVFEQYASNIIQLVKAFLITSEASPTHVRQHVRKRIHCPVEVIHQRGGASETKIDCTAIDYSARGLGLMSAVAIQQGRVEVCLPGQQVPLAGQIVVCQRQAPNRYRLGLLFPSEPDFPEEFLRSDAGHSETQIDEPLDETVLAESMHFRGDS